MPAGLLEQNQKAGFAQILQGNDLHIRNAGPERGNRYFLLHGAMVVGAMLRRIALPVLESKQN
jgi:hypothetical protein